VKDEGNEIDRNFVRERGDREMCGLEKAVFKE
jgi:hypothetical protein